MENRCYDADCLQTSCFNPKHYNYICFDPNCDEIKCTNSNHYNKQQKVYIKCFTILTSKIKKT